MVLDQERQQDFVLLQHDPGHRYLVIPLYSTSVSRFLLPHSRMQSALKPREIAITRVCPRQKDLPTFSSRHSLVHQDSPSVL